MLAFCVRGRSLQRAGEDTFSFTRASVVCLPSVTAIGFRVLGWKLGQAGGLGCPLGTMALRCHCLGDPELGQAQAPPSAGGGVEGEGGESRQMPRQMGLAASAAQPNEFPSRPRGRSAVRAGPASAMSLIHQARMSLLPRRWRRAVRPGEPGGRVQRPAAFGGRWEELPSGLGSAGSAGRVPRAGWWVGRVPTDLGVSAPEPLPPRCFIYSH